MIGQFLFFSGGFGMWEGLLILLVVLILFGGRKIPQLAKDLGQGIREFRKSVSGVSQEIEENTRIDEEDFNEPRTEKKKSSKSARS